MEKEYQYKMPVVNTVTISGNITRDAEMRRTSSGKGVVSFGIAYNNRYKDSAGEWKDADPVFIDVTWWIDSDDVVGKLIKGTPVYINGRISQQKWEKEGKKYSKLDLTAERVQVCRYEKSDAAKTKQGELPAEQTSGKSTTTAKTTTQTKPQEEEQGTNWGDEDEDIPF